MALNDTLKQIIGEANNILGAMADCNLSVSGGYPGEYHKGYTISLPLQTRETEKIFIAGAQRTKSYPSTSQK